MKASTESAQLDMTSVSIHTSKGIYKSKPKRKEKKCLPESANETPSKRKSRKLVRIKTPYQFLGVASKFMFV